MNNKTDMEAKAELIVMKLVATTPKETAPFTIMRGRVMMDARPSAGKYKERMTPSRGR